MHLLLVSATPFEIAPIKAYLEKHFEKKAELHFTKENLKVSILITGVGIAYTSFFLGKVFSKYSFDFAINVGVAGAFHKNLKIGDIVNVHTERFADLGVEEADGQFTDIHQLDLIQPNKFPFQNGKLINPTVKDFDFLPKATGLTVNKVHGFEKSINAIKRKYSEDIESMEGAAFFLGCLLEKIPFLEIRAISNYVEPRNKENWNLPLAIDHLGLIITDILESLELPETAQKE